MIAWLPAAVAALTYFDIPPGILADTIHTFGRQAAVCAFSNPPYTSFQPTHAVVGFYSPRQALDLMLKDSGLEYTAIDATTIAIRSAQPPPPLKLVRPRIHLAIPPIAAVEPARRRPAASPHCRPGMSWIYPEWLRPLDEQFMADTRWCGP